jgi:hypothetical protein
MKLSAVVAASIDTQATRMMVDEAAQFRTATQD